jgi:hypothetical protein
MAWPDLFRKNCYRARVGSGRLIQQREPILRIKAGIHQEGLDAQLQGKAANMVRPTCLGSWTRVIAAARGLHADEAISPAD